MVCFSIYLWLSPRHFFCGPPPPPPPTHTHTHTKHNRGGGGGVMIFTQIFKKTCTLMVCDVPLLRSNPSWGEVLHENQSIVQFDPWLLCSWMFMNIMVLPEGALHVHLSHQVWPQSNECCGRGTPANLACAQCTQMCIVGR